jgi:hypothetical protein
VATFSAGALGSQFAARFGGPGVLDRALAYASATADAIARRKLGRNGQTTLAQSASAGATTLAVASTLGLDAGADAWVQVGAPAAAERVCVLGVELSTSSWEGGPPYPGTLVLSDQTPLILPHGSGEPVQGLVVEKRRARGASTNQVDFGGVITQDAQTAQAHAPHSMLSDLVRVIRLASRPVEQLVDIAVVQRWGSTPFSIPITNVNLNAAQGWYQLPLGTFVPQGSDVITTYVGGYATVPDDVREATELLCADYLTLSNLALVSGMSELGIGARRATVARDKQGKSPYRLLAEEHLARYVIPTL